MWKTLLIAALALAAFPAAAAPRVVSLSLCADPWVMAMADGPQKAGFSNLSINPRYSPAWALFREYSTVSAEMEPLLALKPDLVVLDSFGQGMLEQMLKKAGIATYRMPAMERLADVPAMILALGQVMGQDEKAALFASLWQERWVKKRDARALTAAWYVQPGGYASMPGWVGEVLGHEGYDARPVAGNVEAILAQPRPLLVVEDEGASLGTEWERHPALAHAGMAVRHISGNAVLCPHPNMIGQKAWNIWRD